jgi:hypothetical protein
MRKHTSAVHAGRLSYDSPPQSRLGSQRINAVYGAWLVVPAEAKGHPRGYLRQTPPPRCQRLPSAQQPSARPVGSVVHQEKPASITQPIPPRTDAALTRRVASTSRPTWFHLIALKQWHRAARLTLALSSLPNRAGRGCISRTQVRPQLLSAELLWASCYKMIVLSVWRSVRVVLAELAGEHALPARLTRPTKDDVCLVNTTRAQGVRCVGSP